MREKLKNASILENNVAQQRRDSADLEIKLQEDHKTNEAAIKSATVKVDRAISELYDDRTGNLIIEASKDGPQLAISLQGGGNQGGIDMMKIFCFDIMLYETIAERLGGPGFLVHDSHLFDGVDIRQTSKAIVFGAEMAKQVGGQYIITVNSDVLSKTEVAADPVVTEAILPVRLTDDDFRRLVRFPI